MKKIPANELNQTHMGHIVFLDEKQHYFGEIRGVFLTMDQVVVLTDYPVAAIGVLILGPEDSVQFAESGGFELAGGTW